MEAVDDGPAQEGIGRTGIAIAPSNPRRVYAVVDCLMPEPRRAPPPATPPPVPRRADAAAAPRAGRIVPIRRCRRDVDADVETIHALWGRGWYFEKIAVDPKNADIVYVPNVAV